MAQKVKRLDTRAAGLRQAARLCRKQMRLSWKAFVDEKRVSTKRVWKGRELLAWGLARVLLRLAREEEKRER